jgi:hypothetical protein
MKFLLRLKHWQLFLMIWGLPLGVDIFTIYDPMLLFQLFPIMMIIFTLGTLGWVWAIATALHSQLPANANLKVWQFKIMLSIPIIYIAVLLLSLSINYQFFRGDSGEGEVISLSILPIAIGVHLLSMVCIFLGLRFAAKTMKSVELGRLATFGDYAGEFFLIWFSPVGIWVIQPRLNKLIANR